MEEKSNYHPVPVPLKWHGGKSYLASRIVALMPRHVHYVEPFAGGLAVLLARDPDDPRLQLGASSGYRGVSELANDLNGQLVNFWRVLRGEDTFSIFQRKVQAIPLSRFEWQAASDQVHEGLGDPVAEAVAFFVFCRQSLAGRMKGFTGITRTRTRRGMNGNVSEWLSAVDGLPEVHARLKRVLLENKPALEVIQKEDGPATLFYLDPPYLHETRSTTGEYGNYEMCEMQHGRLLSLIRQVKGKVMLSGYASQLYDDALPDWSRHTFDLPNNAAGGGSKERKTEVLWCNF